MPTDSRSIVIDYNVLKQNEDMGVGSTVEISLGEEQPSVSVTISGLYAPAKVYSGHGRMHLDGATLLHQKRCSTNCTRKSPLLTIHGAL